MGKIDERRKLVRLLQLAYSGELAASLAYEGHARCVRDATERAKILAIRDEELDHRERVGVMLRALGAEPDPQRERRMRRVGRGIALLCRIGGWFVPMYGAARLERGNIGEYERAARFAEGAGRTELVDDLLRMAEVEWDHELYFREKAASHFLWRAFPRWAPPPPRASIRGRHAAESGAHSAPGSAAREAS